MIVEAGNAHDTPRFAGTTWFTIGPRSSDGTTAAAWSDLPTSIRGSSCDHDPNDGRWPRSTTPASKVHVLPRLPPIVNIGQGSLGRRRWHHQRSRRPTDSVWLKRHPVAHKVRKFGERQWGISVSAVTGFVRDPTRRWSIPKEGCREQQSVGLVDRRTCRCAMLPAKKIMGDQWFAERRRLQPHGWLFSSSG